MIPACPTYYPGCIATGSYQKILRQFWVAVGALERSNDSYNQLVLTPKQLAEAKFDWEGVGLKGLPGRNFSESAYLNSSRYSLSAKTTRRLE